ncbi:hypothetical protein FACS1894151_09840 [Spirochaetia bacterium]|nr:hypothetical protein FACS1894151_09840 [Spirochaetia bacterium]
MEEPWAKVSVRLWHPNIKSEEITNNINRKPCIARTVGENYITPRGEINNRINKETYVVYDFPKMKNNDLSDLLEIANLFLKDNLVFLRNLKKTEANMIIIYLLSQKKTMRFHYLLKYLKLV